MPTESTQTETGLVDFMRAKLGPGWAVCRATKRNLARYGACISQKRYAKLWSEWAESSPVTATSDAWRI